MKTRILGRSGLRVSEVGLGCNNFGSRIDLEATRAVVHAALDNGITLFDTADAYGNRGGSETYLGQVLGERRKAIVLATKFGNPMDEAQTLKGGARRYIMTAVEASLKRLNTDWIDLYQLHRPDADTPIEETLRALDDLVRAGKVRYIGASNLSAWQLVEADWTARAANLTRFISHQDGYSLLNREIETELLPAARSYGIGLLPYFPLANGLLTGKYKRGQPLPPGTRLAGNRARAEQLLKDANWEKVARLETFAAGHGHSLLELAFAWLLAKGAASVIAGATKPEQIEANVRAAAWTLNSANLEEIDQLVDHA
ncbi:aldo/keto reductase [Acidocella sp.]|jgi:aryl-alcohol dehydrogenase-like predicted oxidoreductase|uniref:aldo/keto reductase n=1 Tax=Acidocella sp. TaxID=50710 RepID=UPI002F42A8C3